MPLAVVACLVLGTGCNKLRRPKPAPPPPPVAKAAATTSAAPDAGAPDAPVTFAPAPDAKAPGPAYILQKNHALLVLDVDGTASDVSGLPEADLLTQATDGRVYATHKLEVFQLVGKEATRVAWSEGIGSAAVKALAVGTNGHVYASRFGDLMESEAGGKLKEGPKPTLTLLEGMAVDPAGALWIIGSQQNAGSYVGAIFSNGTTLTPPPLPKYAVDSVHDVQSVAAGTFVMRDKDVVLFKGGSGTTVLTAEGLELRHMAVAADGTVVAQQNLGYTAIAALGKKQRAVETHERHYENVALDARGRIWLFLGNALAIVDGKGETTYPQGTIPRWNDVVAKAVVVGAGPAQLVKTAPRTGTVKGTVTHGGTPLAKADVEFCQTVSTLIASHPCEHDISRVAVKTDADGAFAATVPVGPLQMAAKDKKGWVVWRSFSGRAVAEGQALDVGTFDLDKAK